MRLIVVAVALALVRWPTAYGQAVPDEEVVIRSETRLVEVNAVVQDRDGRPVRGLAREDFSITEDGKPQKISFFVLPEKGIPAKFAPNVFSNVMSPDTDNNGSVTAIVMDGLNTDPADQLFVQQQVVAYLQNADTNGRIALFSLTRSVTVLHDFTSNTADLIARAKSFRGDISSLLDLSRIITTDPQAGNIQDASISSLGPEEIPVAGANEQVAAIQSRVRLTLAGLENVGRHLAGLPGRKSIIWISGAFPMIAQYGVSGASPAGRNLPKELAAEVYFFGDQVARMTRRLNDVNVAIYPVDARGLTTAKRNDEISSMIHIAKLTGGRAFYNRNDMARAIRTATGEANEAYTLGYYTSNPKPDDRFREIKVEVRRSGLSVRHRGGYLATKPKPLNAADAKQRLTRVMLEAMNSTNIRLIAKLDPSGNSMQCSVQIDLKTVTLTQKNQEWNGAVEVRLAFVTNNVIKADTSNETLRFHFTRDTYLQAIQNGVTYSKTIPMPAGASHLKIGVMDLSTQEAGTLTIPLSKLVASASPSR